jgi:phage terminase large subunit GpA-like protein
MSNLIDRWLLSERTAWRPAVRLSPSTWAEQHRVLSRTQSARPGRWSNAQSPYLTGLMDLCARRDIEEITIVKAAQIGVSEAIRNVIGYYAHQEPDPILLVLPDEQTGRKIVAQRIVPLLKNTPVLLELFTTASRDVQLRHMSLANGFTLRLGWSGSPASLASDPCRIVINDEVDKFQPWSGKEADPISLGYARTQTYEGRRLIVNISTPTTCDGLITRRYESSSVKLHYHVPCPHCGEFQALVFSNVKWKDIDEPDPNRKAAIIKDEKAAWFECAHCDEAITETQRAGMIRKGRWIADGQRIEKDGTVVGDMPVGSRVGVHIWAAYCLWIPLYRIAAEFIRCKDDPLSLMAFTNSWLGEPFRQQIVHAKVSVFEQKAKSEHAAPPRRVPDWAKALFATADTQKDHFYFVVRAWGVGYRSQRIDHGLVTSFEELRQRTLDARFPWDGPNRNPVHPQLLGIDSGGTGNRTHEVYRFALEDQSRIRAMKGQSHHSEVPVVTKAVTYRPPGFGSAPCPVFLTMMDTAHFKDRLAHAILATVPVANLSTGEICGEAEVWALNAQNDPDYNRQMASEHKVLTRLSNNRRAEVWMPVSSGAANHYWDCEVMQFALADMERLDLFVHERPAPPPKPREPSRFERDGRPFLLTNRPPIRRQY